MNKMFPRTFVMLAWYFAECNSFSYHTYSRIIYKPSTANDHSYFGYTNVLKNSPVPHIIVGAPRDKSNYIAHASISDPGAVYACKIDLQSKQTECDQRTLDPEGNTRRSAANMRSYHHRKDNMWLGMSMTSETDDGITVICSPRWSNQLYNDAYLMNGLCYLTKSVLNSTTTYSLMPLSDLNSQGYNIRNNEEISVYGSQAYYYAYGQAGFSSALSEDATELLLGAPGIFVWKGSFIRYRIAKMRLRDGLQVTMDKVPNTYFTPEIELGDYLGYSVGIGQFVRNRKNLYVSGAPRGSDYKGQVIVFDYPYRENERIKILARLNGTQMGEYFGATIATVDINQDGLTDLIVGAPMHALKRQEDIGRIYVFMNNDEGNFVRQEDTVCGSVRNGARFGSTIASIGDINRDGYLDIAVGAPYENDGTGAVYIYLGAPDGINKVYVQRILIYDMRGFGISISKGVDIDGNTCNDIAIGSHESAAVTLLRCHASVDVVSRIESIPGELLINDTQFTVQICVDISGSEYSTELELNILIDPEYGRAQLEDKNDSTFYLEGSNGSDACKDILINIKEKGVDFSRPIEIQSTYKLKRNPLMEDEFCADCTVLRPGRNQKMIVNVPFAAGCGSDSVCSPDLKVEIDTSVGSTFVIGSAPSVSLNMTLKNSGEPAFLATTEFAIPKHLLLLRIPSLCEPRETKLVCVFGNPLGSNVEKSIVIEFDVSRLKNDDKMLEFNVTATSGGQEVSPEDNNALLNVALQSKAELQIVGNSESLEYILISNNPAKSKNFTVTHSYQVINKGPSPLNTISINFFLPIYWYNETTGKTYELMKVFSPKATIGNQLLQCDSLSEQFYEGNKDGRANAISNDIEDGFAPVSTTPQTILPSSTERDSKVPDNIDISEYFKILPDKLEDEDYPRSMHINCTDTKRVKCMIVECNSTDFAAGNIEAQISFQMILNTPNLGALLKEKSSILLSSYAVVNHTYSGRSSAWAKSLLVGEIPIPAPTPLWIILISALLGVLLLAGISYALYRVGFFTRTTKMEMELLKNQEETQTEDEDNLGYTNPSI